MSQALWLGLKMRDDIKYQFFDDNEAHINNTVSKLLLSGTFIGPLMMLARYFEIFPNVSYTPLILHTICMPVICTLMRILCKWRKYSKITKYLCLLSIEFITLILSIQNGLCVFIAYIFVPVISCLYYNPKFTLKINALCYIAMIISLYIRGTQTTVLVMADTLQGMEWFKAFATGNSFEFFLCTTVTYHVAKVSKNALITQFQQEEKVREIQDKLVNGFANLVESKDNTTGEHIKNTSKYVRMLCYRLKEMGAYSEELIDKKIQYMIKAAPLHDLGKINIPDNILSKPGKLDANEWRVMQLHPLVGTKLIDRNLSDIEDAEYTETAEMMALCHHEWWNGHGYPLSLIETEIPLCARIMAVADVLDALLSIRPYKKSLTLDETLSIMKEMSGKQFDSIIIDALLSLRDELSLEK